MRETWLSENQRLVSQVEHGGALGLSRLVGRKGRESAVGKEPCDVGSWGNNPSRRRED